MTKKIIRYILYPVLVIGITVSLFSVAYAATNSNIDRGQVGLVYERRLDQL